MTFSIVREKKKQYKWIEDLWMIYSLDDLWIIVMFL